MTDIADRYARLAGQFATTVAGVPDDRWSAPTPCEGWTALDLVRHVVDSQSIFEGFVGRGLGDVPSVDEDPTAAWEVASAVVEGHLRDPETAEASFEGLGGRSTFADAVDRFLSFDLVVHRWDLARATGQDETMPPEEVERVRAVAESFGDALRSPQAFGPELSAPEDADAQARLLAFLGRRA